MHLDIVNNVLNILYICVLIFGIIISKRHSFLPGVLSFLLLIVNQVILFSIPRIIELYMKSGTKPFDFTMGELVYFVSLIPNVIQLIAFAILTIGLYKMWKSRVLK